MEMKQYCACTGLIIFEMQKKKKKILCTDPAAVWRLYVLWFCLVSMTPWTGVVPGALEQ